MSYKDLKKLQEVEFEKAEPYIVGLAVILQDINHRKYQNIENSKMILDTLISIFEEIRCIDQIYPEFLDYFKNPKSTKIANELCALLLSGGIATKIEELRNFSMLKNLDFDKINEPLCFVNILKIVVSHPILKNEYNFTEKELVEAFKNSFLQICNA